MFLNPLMLAGLGGAVLPLVLHLLNRARYRTVDWGAMMFLPGAHGRQQQSNRLKQLLLLILRMALIALLAIALARPVVGSTWAAMGTDPHCCCVILLDNSASMAFDEGGGPRIDAARRAALAVLATLQRGDEVDLLTLADAPDSSNEATPPTGCWSSFAIDRHRAGTTSTPLSPVPGERARGSDPRATPNRPPSIRNLL